MEDLVNATSAIPPTPRSLQPFNPASAHSILFLCLARDCEATLPRFFTYIQELNEAGIPAAALVGENGSRDRTRALLQAAAGARLAWLDTGFMAVSPERLTRMAMGRESLLTEARRLQLGEAYICVVDLDGVMAAPPSPPAMHAALACLAGDPSLFALSASSYPVYYDLLSLRSTGHDYRTLHKDLVQAKRNPLTYYRFHRRAIYRHQREMTQTADIPCLSSFNGLCLYRAGNYYAGTYRALDEAEICEHVSLNLAIAQATQKTMMISSALRLQAPADHIPVNIVRFWFDRIRERV